MENNKIPGTVDNLVNELLGIKQEPNVEVFQNAFVLSDASGKVTAEIARIRNYGNLAVDEVAKVFMDNNPVISRKIKQGTLFCEFAKISRIINGNSEFVDETNICARIDNITFNPAEKEQISIVCELKSTGGKYLYVFDDIQKSRYQFSLRPRFVVSNDSVIIVTWDIWL